MYAIHNDVDFFSMATQKLHVVDSAVPLVLRPQREACFHDSRGEELWTWTDLSRYDANEWLGMARRSSLSGFARSLLIY